MKVPFNDLTRLEPEFLFAVRASLERVLDRGWYVLGPETQAFEQSFARYCGVDHCVSVGSGTAALRTALAGMRIGPGSRVGTVANAGGYATTAIRALGAHPVYFDVDPATLNLDPSVLGEESVRSLDALVVTHLYGRPVPMAEVLERVRPFGVPVVEDCAQAHGLDVCGRRAGAWGDAGCFSFYPTKNLGAMGDGGAIVTSRSDLAVRFASLRQYGWSSKYRVNLERGDNSRLDEMQAAILSAGLPFLETWNDRRRWIARRYGEGLSGTLLTLPQKPDTEDHVYHLYVIQSGSRDDLAAGLCVSGVSTAVHFPIADHRQPAWADSDVQGFSLPATEVACSAVLSLPCFPQLTDREVDEVIRAVRSILESGRDLV